MDSSSASLSLQDFVDLSQVFNADQFTDPSALAYLGPALSAWLDRLLGRLQVGTSPLIEGHVAAGAFVEGRVYIAKGAHVEPTAYIQGPCYIGPDAQVRHGAYIRGQVYVGRGAVVGHTTEVKGSVFFDEAKAGHFAYVGDSILGCDVNLGAGTKLANLPLVRREVRVIHPRSGRVISTGLKKFGAIVGDRAQTGCNSVLSPGTLMMPQSAVYPCVHFRGTLAADEVRRS